MNLKLLSGVTSTAFFTILGTTAFLGNSQLAAVASNLDTPASDRISEKSQNNDVVLGGHPGAITTFIDSLKENSDREKSKPSKTDMGETGLKQQMRGMASWYGPGFHGRQTANGEQFNQNDLTAAHRNLPFGTKVRVTNNNNGRSVVVRINDRGPYAGGRVIDLSAAAAAAIGLQSSGVGPVTIEVLGR